MAVPDVSRRLEPLEQVLERLGRFQGPRTPVVVFDLDSTLIDTSPRHLAILDDFIAAGFGGSDLSKVCDRLHEQGVSWSLVDEVRRAGIQDQALLKALADFWSHRFFSPEYMSRDRPVPGAATFVLECRAVGAWCYYLTARVEAETRAVTRATLRRFGFPLESGVTLHMKPARTVGDHRFKESAMAQVVARGYLVAVFDNDPVNINAFQRRFPGAVCVLVGNARPPDAPPVSDGVLWIPDFIHRVGVRSPHSS